MALSKRGLPEAEEDLPNPKRPSQPPSCLLYKSFPISGEPSQEEMRDALIRLALYGDIQQRPQKRQFGNSEGIEKMDQLDRIEDEISGLKSSYKTLESSHEDLKSSHEVLESSNKTLESNHEALESSHEALKSSHEALESSHEALESSHEALKEQTSFLEPMSQAYSTIRRHILEGRDGEHSSSGKTDLEAISQRNEMAHGGNIAADCYILKQLQKEDMAKFEKCCRQFVQMYGIEFQTIYPAIQSSPSIKTLCDFRVHVLRLHKWKYAEEKRLKLSRKIGSKCDEGISSWKRWANTKPRTGPEPDLDGIARQVRELNDQYYSTPS